MDTDSLVRYRIHNVPYCGKPGNTWYLLQRGFIVRTPRGRVATEKAYKHLGRAYKKGKNDKNIKQENFFKDE